MDIIAKELGNIADASHYWASTIYDTIVAGGVEALKVKLPVMVESAIERSAKCYSEYTKAECSQLCGFAVIDALQRETKLSGLAAEELTNLVLEQVELEGRHSGNKLTLHEFVEHLYADLLVVMSFVYWDELKVPNRLIYNTEKWQGLLLVNYFVELNYSGSDSKEAAVQLNQINSLRTAKRLEISLR